MKFLVGSDFHFRDDKPRCRADDWFETQTRRIQWLVNQININECPMFVAGDFMDAGSVSQRLENMLIRELKLAEFPIWSIAGNHDCQYHNIKHMEKSTYWVLHQAGAIQHISGTGMLEKLDIPFSAFQYGEPMVNGTGIALCHRLVFPNDPPPYLPSAIKASELLDMYDYDIILSGDNHMAFYTEHDGKLLINGGGLFRQTADKKYQIPKIYLYDNGVVTEIEVPVDIENVQQEYLLEEKERLERINVFVERVQVSKDIGLSFTDNIDNAIKTSELDTDTIEIIQKALRGELI